MKSGNFSYLLKEGIKGIGAHKLMSFASIGVLVACLVLIGCATLFAANVNSAVSAVEGQNEMAVFLSDDITQEQTNAIKQKLDGIEGIASIKYISKEDALKQQIEAMGSTGDILKEYADASWLPASFVVKLEDISTMKDMKATFESIENVKKVRAPQEFADAIMGIKNIVTSVGYGMVLILVLVALVIISNTIRLTVFARRREVNIMKYVGATNGFIRLPFIIEGVFIGIISAVISFLILWAGYYGVGEWMAKSLLSSFGGATALMSFSSIALYLGAGFLFIGILTGAVGSTLALRKHLKV